MPTNANTFNSRVTSEALEAKFRQVFPAQGGAELVQDLFASGVIQPVVDFSTVAEGSVLPQNLQTAWDFSTGASTVANATTTIITTPGFWQIDLNCFIEQDATAKEVKVVIDDGFASKRIWEANTGATTASVSNFATDTSFVAFVRAGDAIRVSSSNTYAICDVWYRQIADVNGNLVNPLGFTFS